MIIKVKVSLLRVAGHRDEWRHWSRTNLPKKAESQEEVGVEIREEKHVTARHDNFACYY